MPGRRDAPPSISMSCSDKILMWNAVGIQGAFLSLWLTPIFLTSVVISMPQESQWGIHQNEYGTKCVWALKHRISPLKNHNFKVLMVPMLFSDSRESVELRVHQEYGVSPADESWSKVEPDPCAACMSNFINNSYFMGARLQNGEHIGGREARRFHQTKKWWSSACILLVR